MIEHDPGGPDLVQDLSTFKAFVANIVDRCESPPVETKALVVGGYR
jgi:hypothetical protein